MLDKFSITPIPDYVEKLQPFHKFGKHFNHEFNRFTLTSRFSYLFNDFNKELFFDNTKKNSFLYVNAGTEKYLVSSNDKIIAKVLFTNGVFDFDKFYKVTQLLGENFKRRLLVDIGANIGTICIPAIKRNLFEYAIGFEPDSFNYHLLVKNIKMNSLKNRIKTFQHAFGQNPSELLTFEQCNFNFGDHRIKTTNEDGIFNEHQRNLTSVRSTNIDSVFKSLVPSETLFWIDVQGYEGYILSGAKNTLKKNPPLVSEFWPYGMNRANSYELFKSTIIEAQYSHFYDLSDHENTLYNVSNENFDRIFNKLGVLGDHTDFLFIKK